MAGVWKNVAVVSLVAGLVLLGATEAATHSQDKDHMAAMERQKERVPEEYRIMNRTPVTPHRSSLLSGRDLFVRHCARCHGEQGLGDGTAAASLKTPPTSFRDLGHSDFLGPGEKYWTIRNGFPEAGMPDFAGVITPTDRWHLVNYIFALQKSVRRQSRGAHDH
jgi:cytochrome c1